MMRVVDWFQRTQMKTLIALAFGVLMLTFAAIQSILSQAQQRDAAHWSAHSFEVLVLAERLGADSLQVDQRAREFIYRRSLDSRQQFYILKKGLDARFRQMETMVGDNENQVLLARAAHEQSARQLAALTTLVERYDHSENDVMGKMHALTGMNDLTRVTQSSLNRLVVREHQFLATRQHTLETAQNISTIWMFVFLISGSIVIAFSFRSAVMSNMTLAQKARLEERESRAEELRASEMRANEQSRLLTALNSASASLASEHDLPTIVQDVVDYGVAITGAEYGAFFFMLDHDGEKALHLEALSSTISRDLFPATDYLRATELFVTHNSEILISDDISQHPKYGMTGSGCPAHHPAVRSYIGIPIISNDGVQIGSLMFGHSQPSQFTQLHEQTVKGLSGITSIVIENARLYSAAQRELDERIRYEQELVEAANRQSLLLRELNHRVKNTLVTVQSIAMQTKNAAISKLGIDKDSERLANLTRFYGAFESRLLSLSGTHDLLVNGAWSDVLLYDALWAALGPLIEPERVKVTGPHIWLSPNAAVTLNMLFHELSTNAIKYGAISGPTGSISIKWLVENQMLKLLWKETGGPTVKSPDGSGFGSKLLDRAVRREMKGKSSLSFMPEGVECYMEIPLSVNIRETS